MKAEGRIAYRHQTSADSGNTKESTVYVNLVPRYACTNSCIFCDRPRNKEEYGLPCGIEQHVGSLYHDKVPSMEDIMRSVGEQMDGSVSNVVFVALGEPLLVADTVIETIGRVKRSYDVKTCIDTSGVFPESLVDRLEAAGLDSISISLNARDRDEYEMLCRPYSRDAFEKAVAFAQRCNAGPIDTKVSFVIDYSGKGGATLGYFEQDKYIDFAKTLGFDDDQIVIRPHEPIFER